jgi:nucleotide-binding universal stress UspA family protein
MCSFINGAPRRSLEQHIVSTRILVAVGAGFSEAALAVAMARARETNARLTVLHVIDDSPRWYCAFGQKAGNTSALVRQLARSIRENCQKAARAEGIEIEWRVRLAGGRSVAYVIAETAERMGADVVVLGTGKRGWRAPGWHRVRGLVRRRTSCEVLIATDRTRDGARVVSCPCGLHAARSVHV